MTEAAAPPAAPAEDGFFSRLSGLYFSPSEAFQAIVARPMLGVALLASFLVNLAFVLIWVPKVDPYQFMRNQIEESGQAAKLTAEQVTGAVNQQAPYFKYFAYPTPVFIMIWAVILAAILLLVFKLFYSWPVTFKQSLAIVLWTFLATQLVTGPLTLVVLALKGDWSIDPGQALMANAAVLLDKGETSKALYSLANSLDLFSFWTMFLLSAGYAATSRRTAGSAAAGIVGLWGLYVVIKVGWAALQ
jgi:hypothetical protein